MTYDVRTFTGMVTEPKSERLEIRLSQTEAAMLRELADRDGVSSAVVVRMLIRAAHARLTPSRRAKTEAQALGEAGVFGAKLFDALFAGAGAPPVRRSTRKK